jgi:hypothetical protein
MSSTPVVTRNAPHAPVSARSFPVVLAVWTVGWMTGVGPALAAPVLTSAEARIAFELPSSCTVELALAIDGASQVEHRVESLDGSRVALLAVTGAIQEGEPRAVGRTLSLRLTPSQPTYTLRYRVQQPAARRDRCPVWLPSIPADGRSKNVRLIVQLPAGATAGGTMPGFAWTGAGGAATLGHLPAFVRVAYAEAGGTPPWDVSRVMDVVTVAALAAASALWLRRRRARAARRLPPVAAGAAE